MLIWRKKHVKIKLKKTQTGEPFQQYTNRQSEENNK